MPDCSQETANLALIAFTSAMVTIKFIIDIFRHEHIKSDNQRLLHVVEGKTEHASDVK